MNEDYQTTYSVKWESGEYTIYDIADEYSTTPEAVLKLLGLVENPF